MMLSAVAAMRRCYPGLRVTLPPPIYSPSVTAKTLLAMMQQRVLIGMDRLELSPASDLGAWRL